MCPINITSTFIDLRSDYGFKRLFGDKKRVGIMKRFLNALFEGEMVIADIEYHDKEILPPSAKGKRIIYDIYCTTDTGHHFVVEMQQEYSDIFGKRVLFYVSAALYRQGEQGKNYDSYQPVVAVVVTDFSMLEFENKLVNDVVLMERTTHRILSEDMRIMFVSLASVPKDWRECDTELKRLLYLIKAPFPNFC